MNVREGTRRLAILLGACGAILGGSLGYSDARAVWDGYTAHRRFESVMATPTMRKVAKASLDYQREYWKDPWAKYREAAGQRTYANGTIRDDIKKNGFGDSFVPDKPANGGELVVLVGVDGIQEVVANKGGTISSIELSTDEWVHQVEPPSMKAYLIPLLFPVLGFLLPWSTVHLLTWVGRGFFAPRQ